MRRKQPEQIEQEAVVALLRKSDIMFAASLNGVRLGITQRIAAKDSGMEPGEPDLRIYDRPPNMPQYVGMAIEMKAASRARKTTRGMKWGVAEPHQRERLQMLEDRGWWCVVCCGREQAIDELKACGYALVGV